MDELKVHIRHVMVEEFNNSKDDKERIKKICGVYGQGKKRSKIMVIAIFVTGLETFIWAIRHREMDPDHDDHQTTIKTL